MVVALLQIAILTLTIYAPQEPGRLPKETIIKIPYFGTSAMADCARAKRLIEESIVSPYGYVAGNCILTTYTPEPERTP